MKQHTRNTLCWLSIIIGVATSFVGCIISVAMRNPGGPPVSNSEAKHAVRIAYFACAVGFGIATIVPATILIFERTKK